jgi:hypothetical protein
VREDKRKGIYIAGVTEAYVTNEAELLAVMSEGQKNRSVPHSKCDLVPHTIAQSK